MTSKWGTDTTIKFIELYKKNVCLWNTDSPDYKTKPVREAAYDNLVKGMNLPGFTVQDVKNKIKNLRSTYCQEAKKMAESKRSGGPVYEPSLRWLKNIEPVFTYARSIDNACQDEDSSKSDGRKNYYLEINTSKRLNNKSTKLPLPLATSKRKRKIVYSYDDSSRLEALDAFGKSVVMQLKNLSEERALMAQSQIQSLLTEYGVADLKDKRSHESGASFTFVSSKEESLSSPRSNCSNDEAESVVSNPESKYFERYPEELRDVHSDEYE